MATRRYTPRIRQVQILQRQERVAAAAAELHAEKGGVATSYSDIARRAGVSLPTVHSYFPTQAALMSACTGHVGARAPVLPVPAILAAPDLHAATRTLVDAMDRLHAYFEPWASWRQETAISFLADLNATHRAQLTGVLIKLLDRFGKGSQASHAAVWESLLSFDLWQRLVRQHGMKRVRVRAILTDLLMAALGPAPSTVIQPGPRKGS